MKAMTCNTCQKKHKTPAELTYIGIDQVASYWNCPCGSTLMITPYEPEQIQEILAKLMGG